MILSHNNIDISIPLLNGTINIQHNGLQYQLYSDDFGNLKIRRTRR